MEKKDRISMINAVLKKYFATHKGEVVPAKELMPLFIEEKIFSSDNRGGNPLRKILRELDKNNELHLIPYIYPDRKQKNVYWYFTDAENTTITTIKKKKVTTKTKKSSEKRYRDEDYIIDLCDKLLKQKSLRQHRFDFLRGDFGTTLPVDAYYKELNVVIEYRERQHTESVKHWNKLKKNGITRDEQRAKYDQLRRDMLPQHGILLIEISYFDFQHNSKKRLLRILEEDTKIIERILRKNSLL